VAVRPSVTYGYGYAPTTYTYNQPTYYGYQQAQTYPVRTPTYTTPTYNYARPTVVYATPSYTTPQVVYSTPSYGYSTPTYTTSSYAYSTPSYTTTPTFTYARPTYNTTQTVYSTPSYTTPTYGYSTYATPGYAYSTPSYTTTPTFTYSTPTYNTTQNYSVPVSTTPVYTQPVTWSQPTPSWSSYPTAVAYGSYGYSQPSGNTTWEPRYQSMAWSQPTYYPSSASVTPTMSYNYVPSYSSQRAPVQDVVVSNPFPTQPTLGFAPSGNYQQRLMAPPSYTPGYAARPVVNPYR